MSSLSDRVAAAIAARADTEPRCCFCRATDELERFHEEDYPPAWVCADEDACHSRFVILNEIVRRPGQFYCPSCDTDEAMPGHEC